MFPGSESAGSWARGLRIPWALALEALRFAVALGFAVTLIFLAVQLGPTPALSLVPHNPQYAGLAQQNMQTFALNQPVWERYGVWLADVFLGRLGVSYYYRLPVVEVLLPRMPATVELMIGTTLWAVVLGGLLGWAAASRRRTVDLLSRGVGLLLYALPLFWFLLLLLVGIDLAWGVGLGTPLPPSPVRPQPTGFPVLDALLSGDLGEAWLVFWTTALLCLPAGAALALPILLRVRKSLRAARESPAFARLPADRGLPPLAAFRTVLAPVAGGVAAILPFVVSSVLVAEWFGNRRGLGWYLVQGFGVLDVPLLQGAITILVILAVASALPFALLEAAFLRRTPEAVPQPIPDDDAIGSGIRAAARRFRRRPALVFWIGLALFAVPVGMTALAPVLSPYGPLQRVTDTTCSPLSPGAPYLQSPCPAHPLGTNYLSEDIWSQVLSGGLEVMGVTAVALATSAGIAFGLALLCGVVGRWVDAPLRVMLGAIATLPALVLFFLLFVSFIFGVVGGTSQSALELVFVPILFRDARNLVGRAERPTLLARSDGTTVRGLGERLHASVAAVGPGLVARLPRRLAEMALLFELFSAFGTLPPTAVDWATIVLQAVEANAIRIGNAGWLLVPGLVLFLYVAGLLLMASGLRPILVPEPPRPALVSAPPVPQQAQPAPAASPYAPPR